MIAPVNNAVNSFVDSYKKRAIAASHERCYYYSRYFQSSLSWFNSKIKQPLDKANPLFIALPVSLLFHAGLFYVASPNFGDDKPAKIKTSQTLEIILLNIKPAIKEPDKVDLIAQVNTEASGSSDKKARPMSNDSNLSAVSAIEKEMALAMKTPSTPSTPSKIPQVIEPEIITTTSETPFEVSSFKTESQKKPSDNSMSEIDRILAQIETLEVEIGADQINYNKRPKVRFLDTLAAKSAEEAEYLVTWAKHVERIGTQYFPKMAIKEKLSGLLILQVVLDHNGKVISAEIQSGSGFSVLDNGAMRIIKLAAPFPPLPKVIRYKWDHLSITRTWVFHGDGSTPIYTQ